MIFITSSGDVSLGNTLRLTGFGIDLWAAPADDGASWAWSGEDERTERVRRVATIRNVRGMPRLRSGECDAETRTHCCTLGFEFCVRSGQFNMAAALHAGGAMRGGGQHF